MLPQADKDRWNAVAKAEKKKLQADDNNKFAGTGETVAQVKKKEREESRNVTEMINNINTKCNDLHKRKSKSTQRVL